MPQYQIIIKDKNSNSENQSRINCSQYLVLAENEKAAEKLASQKTGEVISIEEVEVWIVFQLLDDYFYRQAKELAEGRGLKTSKATGFCRLKVSGKGDWFKSDWVLSLKKVNSNLVSHEPQSNGR